MLLEQNGNDLTATALENKGPIAWQTKTTKGKLNDGTMSFRWYNRDFFGKISDDNNRVVWDVVGTDVIWTRISANDDAKKAIPTTTSPIQLSGRWSISQNNGFSGKMDLHQDSSGKLTGDVGWNGNLFGSIKGSVSGNVVSFTISYPGKMKGHYKGTITEGGTRLINGTSTASTGDTATWSAKQEIKKVITGYGKKK